jgi:hypothetical protein
MDVKERVYYNTPEPDPTTEAETRYAIVNSGHDVVFSSFRNPRVNKTIICVAPQGSMLKIIEGPVEINFTKVSCTNILWLEGWTIESSLTLMINNLYFKEALKKRKKLQMVLFLQNSKNSTITLFIILEFELQAMRRSFRTWKTVD